MTLSIPGIADSFVGAPPPLPSPPPSAPRWRVLLLGGVLGALIVWLLTR
jgi:hypothetical protein